MLNNHIIPSRISDNFFYIIEDGGVALAIDPVDPHTCIQTLESKGLQLLGVVNTHYHWDHINGNEAIAKAFPHTSFFYPHKTAKEIEQATGIAPTQTLDSSKSILFKDARIELVSHKHEEEEPFRIDILDTPGHTPGHISLYSQNNRSLWCGDTIFIGGAGNCINGGDPHTLYTTFRDVLSQLPDDTDIYCGHDYSIRNWEFCLSIDPENATTQKLLQERRSSTNNNKKVKNERSFFISTLGKERSYNPFFRYDDPILHTILKSSFSSEWNEAENSCQSVDEQAFVTLRLLRNKW